MPGVPSRLTRGGKLLLLRLASEEVRQRTSKVHHYVSLWTKKIELFASPVQLVFSVFNFTTRKIPRKISLKRRRVFKSDSKEEFCSILTQNYDSEEDV